MGFTRSPHAGHAVLPRLDGEDLYVCHEELEAFRQECHLLLENIHTVAPPDNPKDSRLNHEYYVVEVTERLTYILEAIERAEQLERGAVVIW
nr:hypothetical protein GCM10017745_46900 [Saccharothrix mutabilis subsp. capreolus]